MSNYHRYQDALTSAGRGTPLWEHAGENGCKPIRIGDIGYLRFGLFVQVFNATLPPGHPDNQFGEPPCYTPLLLDPSLIQRATTPKGIVASSGVQLPEYDVDRLVLVLFFTSFLITKWTLEQRKPNSSQVYRQSWRYRGFRERC